MSDVVDRTRPASSACGVGHAGVDHVALDQAEDHERGRRRRRRWRRTRTTSPPAPGWTAVQDAAARSRTGHQPGGHRLMCACASGSIRWPAGPSRGSIAQAGKVCTTPSTVPMNRLVTDSTKNRRQRRRRCVRGAPAAHHRPRPTVERRGGSGWGNGELPPGTCAQADHRGPGQAFADDLVQLPGPGVRLLVRFAGRGATIAQSPGRAAIGQDMPACVVHPTLLERRTDACPLRRVGRRALLATGNPGDARTSAAVSSHAQHGGKTRRRWHRCGRVARQPCSFPVPARRPAPASPPRCAASPARVLFQVEVGAQRRHVPHELPALLLLQEVGEASASACRPVRW